MIVLAEVIELAQRTHRREKPGHARVGFSLSGMLQSALDDAVELATERLGEESPVITR